MTYLNQRNQQKTWTGLRFWTVAPRSEEPWTSLAGTAHNCCLSNIVRFNKVFKAAVCNADISYWMPKVLLICCILYVPPRNRPVPFSLISLLAGNKVQHCLLTSSFSCERLLPRIQTLITSLPMHLYSYWWLCLTSLARWNVALLYNLGLFACQQ